MRKQSPAITGPAAPASKTAAGSRGRRERRGDSGSMRVVWGSGLLIRTTTRSPIPIGRRATRNEPETKSVIREPGRCDRGVDDRDLRQGARRAVLFARVLVVPLQTTHDVSANARRGGTTELTVKRLVGMAVFMSLRRGAVHVQRRNIQLNARCL